jgi:hypothetical protein
MTNSQNIQRSAKTGQFTKVKALGRSKAAKFAQVEGMSLSQTSVTAIHRFEARGLKGDALRSAIAGSFQKK